MVDRTLSRPMTTMHGSPLVKFSWLTSCIAVGAIAAAARSQAPLSSSSSDETRIRITQSMLPLTISSPNSYYFGSSLTWSGSGSAITVATQAGGAKTTIDLCGFALRRTGGTTFAIGIAGTGDERSVLHVHGGSIEGFSPGAGVRASPGATIAEDLAFSNCESAIVCNGGSVVTRCVFARCNFAVFDYGNLAGAAPGGGTLVSSCAAKLCLAPFYGLRGTRFVDCNVGEATEAGFTLGSGASAQGCVVDGAATAIGIATLTGAESVVVRDCSVRNVRTGLSIAGSSGRFEDNHLHGAGPGPGESRSGIVVQSGAARNRVAGNTVIGFYTASTPNNHVLAPGTDNQLELLISQLPESFAVPCHVTLAGSLKGSAGLSGLIVASDNVTIDLGGHALIGATGSVDGIAVPNAVRGLVVRNGSIVGWGSSGIWATNAERSGFESLLIRGNGQHGLVTGLGSRLQDLRLAQNGLTGTTTAAQCSILRVAADDNRQQGVLVGERCQVIDCRASNNLGAGFAGSHTAHFSGCMANSNAREGFWVDNDAQLTDCTATGNTLDGIRVGSRCVISACSASGNAPITGANLSAAGNGNRIEGNRLANSSRDLWVGGSGNLIVRNSIATSAPGTAVVIAAGNSHGPFVNVIGVGDLGTVPAATHPLANLFH